MAEMALAAFATMGAASMTAGAGAGIMAALPAMSTAATVLQGVATAGSVLTGIMQARQTRQAGDAAEIQGRQDADLALIEGERAANASAARASELRRDAVRKTAAARVAFAGSGLDVSSGQLEGIEGDIGNEAGYGIAFEDVNQRAARDEARLHSQRYLARGENAKLAARAKAAGETIGAFGAGAKGLLSIVKRG